jgi:N-acyl-D-aspartate/D-glutamate deacylase
MSPQSMLVGGKPAAWTTLGEYFQVVEKAGISVNIASYVGIDNVWQSVMGTSYEKPTKDQLAEMQKLVEQSMQDGAIGLSTMLAMPPGSLATLDDLVLLCEPVHRHGGLYSTHNRNEGTGVFDAIREAIGVGERAKIPVDIIHVKIADQQYWGRMKEIIDIINDGLLPLKYVLINRRTSFTLVPADIEIDQILMPRVTLEELADHGQTEVVSTILKLKTLVAEDLASEVKKQMGPFGKVVTLTSMNQLLIQDTAGNLQRIIATIQETDKAETFSHKCIYIRAREAEAVLRAT